MAPLFLLLCLMLLALWAAAVQVWRRILPGAPSEPGRGRPAVPLVLRAAALSAVAGLFWKAFFSGEEHRLEGRSESRPVEVVVLQDCSASMELPGAAGQRRQELADSLWDEVRARAGSAPSSFSLKRYFFAGNLVEEARSEGEAARSLQRNRTALRQALTEVLSRMDPRSLLIASDGITTDGVAPSYLLDWARNRRIRVGAICAAEPDLELCDRAIARVDCEPANPSAVTARVLSCGSLAAPLRVTLSIDGKRAGEVRRGAEEVQEVALRVPPLERGWHEYAVEVEAAANEATLLNNSYRGVFRVDRAGILLVHDRPATEHLHLARFLRGRLEGDLLCLRTNELREEAPQHAHPSLVILTGVAPDKVPLRLREAWVSQRVPLLILEGEGLEGWVRLGGPGFPLAALGGVAYLGGDDHSATVSLEPRVARRADPGEATVEPPLDLLREASLRAGARLVRGVKTDRGLLPFLVSDSSSAPRFTVLLADTTWKWALHPQGSVRQAYRLFWSDCLDFVLQGTGRDYPLLLDLKPPRGGEDPLEGRVTTVERGERRRLVNFRIAVDGWAQSGEVREDGDGLAFRIPRPAPDAEPEITWLQAQAELDGKAVESERAPLVLRADRQEWRRVLPDAEALKSQTTGEEHSFAWYPGRAAVIESLFQQGTPAGKASRVRRREGSWEILLAAAAVLSLAAEWWIERRLRSGSRP